MAEAEDGLLRYSVSLVTQGDHRFYTLTIPSNILARTAFASPRDEDPQKGFQRLLDKDRAQQIADYVDSEKGTIPNSVVLSAQPDAELQVIGRGKTLQFRDTPRAFLILDGQHRVYGFSLAKTALRVPVVVYSGLSRKEETRLFIDINTKQRPVPNELLLDIKSLAEYESDTEYVLRQIFDLFATEVDSPLLGLMSPAERTRGKLSRVTFNAAAKPLVPVFGEADPVEIYAAMSAYLRAFIIAADSHKLGANIVNPTVFKAVMLLFTDVARRVKDRFGSVYSTSNFELILAPMLLKLKKNTFTMPGNSYKVLLADLQAALRSGFTLL